MTTMLAHLPGTCNPAAWFKLNTNQRGIASGIYRGETNQMMADALGVSVKTIEYHRKKIMKKLGAASFAELIRILDRV